jgi:ketosteroid isomerase-like protein
MGRRQQRSREEVTGEKSEFRVPEWPPKSYARWKITERRGKMKVRMFVLAVFVLTFVLPVALRAQETDPTAVVAALEEAMNAGDVDAAMGLVADDVIFTMTMLGEDEVLTGAAEVKGLFEELVANDFQIQIEPLQVEGDTVTTKTLTWGGGMPPGVAPMVAEETYVIQDEKIKSITWVASEESNAKWLAAVEAMEPETMPETGGAAMPVFAGIMVLGALVVLGGLSLVLRSLSGHTG